MSNWGVKSCVAGIFGMLAGAVVSESAIIAYQDGDTSAHANWALVSTQGFGGAIVFPTNFGAGHSTAVGITNSTGAGPDTALIYNTGGLIGNYLGGTWGTTNIRSIVAEFYAYQAVGTDASDFRLYMIAGGHTWYYDAGPLSAGWNMIYANMVHTDDPLFTAFEGWYSEDGWTMANFLADLGNVTAIGFELQYLINQNNQTYGFDYIGLYDNYFLPEPETYLVLLVALASLAFVFRAQVYQTIGMVLARVKA